MREALRISERLSPFVRLGNKFCAASVPLAPGFFAACFQDSSGPQHVARPPDGLPVTSSRNALQRNRVPRGPLRRASHQISAKKKWTARTLLPRQIAAPADACHHWGGDSRPVAQYRGMQSATVAPHLTSMAVPDSTPISESHFSRASFFCKQAQLGSRNKKSCHAAIQANSNIGEYEDSGLIRAIGTRRVDGNLRLAPYQLF